MAHEHDAAMMIASFGECHEQWHDRHLIVRHQGAPISLSSCDDNVIRQPHVAPILPFGERFDLNLWLRASHRDSDIRCNVLVEQ